MVFGRKKKEENLFQEENQEEDQDPFMLPDMFSAPKSPPMPQYQQKSIQQRAEEIARQQEQFKQDQLKDQNKVLRDLEPEQKPNQDEEFIIAGLDKMGDYINAAPTTEEQMQIFYGLIFELARRVK